MIQARMMDPPGNNPYLKMGEDKSDVRPSSSMCISLEGFGNPQVSVTSQSPLPPEPDPAPVGHWAAEGFLRPKVLRGVTKSGGGKVFGARFRFPVSLYGTSQSHWSDNQDGHDNPRQFDGPYVAMTSEYHSREEAARVLHGSGSMPQHGNSTYTAVGSVLVRKLGAAFQSLTLSGSARGRRPGEGRPGALGTSYTHVSAPSAFEAMPATVPAPSPLALPGHVGQRAPNSHCLDAGLEQEGNRDRTEDSYVPLSDVPVCRMPGSREGLGEKATCGQGSGEWEVGQPGGLVEQECESQGGQQVRTAAMRQPENTLEQGRGKVVEETDRRGSLPLGGLWELKAEGARLSVALARAESERDCELARVKEVKARLEEARARLVMLQSNMAGPGKYRGKN
ncbi:unnamed protein product [Discosporangium mesarthrocarpum]